MAQHRLVILTARVDKDTIPEAYQKCSKCSKPYTWTPYHFTPRMPLRLMLAVNERYESTPLCQHITCSACMKNNWDKIPESLQQQTPLWCCAATSSPPLGRSDTSDGPAGRGSNEADKSDAAQMLANIQQEDNVGKQDRRSEDTMRKTGQNAHLYCPDSESARDGQMAMGPEWDLLMQEGKDLEPGFTLADVQALVMLYHAALTGTEN